jgi:hypothetical protein
MAEVITDLKPMWILMTEKITKGNNSKIMKDRVITRMHCTLPG